MAIANKVSQTIPAKVLEDAITKVNEALTLLMPFLVQGLTSADIQGMAKLGEKSEPFVEKGLEFAVSNPQFIPPWANVEEANKDFKYFNDLRPLDTLLQQFSGLVSVSRTEAGAETLDVINDLYKMVSDAHEKGVAVATPIYTELNKRYKENGRRSKKATK